MGIASVAHDRLPGGDCGHVITHRIHRFNALEIATVDNMTHYIGVVQLKNSFVGHCSLRQRFCHA